MFQNEYLAKSIEMFTKIPIVTRRGSLLKVALVRVICRNFQWAHYNIFTSGMFSRRCRVTSLRQIFVPFNLILSKLKLLQS